MKTTALLATLGLLLSACTTSRVESSWKDPAATSADFDFKKVLVMLRAKDGSVRRVGEDELVRFLSEGERARAGQLTAEPSYRLLPGSEIEDKEKARAMVEAQGFDGLILMSFVSSEQRVTVQPPTIAYGSVWGYYGARPIVYDPGYVRTDDILRVETAIYDIPEGKLLWTGVSRTLNPYGVNDLVAGVAESVGKALREQGLIR